MAITTSFGYTDSIGTTKNIAIPDLSYTTDFAITKEVADEVVLTNRTSPIDQPETIRFGYQNVANVYANTGIDPSYMSVSRRGVSLVAQVNDILRVSCDGGENACNLSIIDLPMTAHIVVKVPLIQYVTAELAMGTVNRAISSLYDTGKTSTSRLEAMLRHALTPTGM